MPKYSVGQTVFVEVNGRAEEVEIDSIGIDECGISYTLKRMPYRLYESDVFETKEDCEEYIEENYPIIGEVL